MLLENYNINLVDSELIREKFAGSYIVHSENEAAIVEVSTSHCIPLIMKSLNELKIDPLNVKYLFITHIHLDHASGAGRLLQELPNAKLIVHPTGAKHMINPEKLIEGANQVYGEEVVKNDYGVIAPVPADKVIECEDNQVFSVGNRELTTIYTPGHARHHLSVYDNLSKGIFTGDSFGLSYPELDIRGKRFCQPTTTPTAFEYDKMVDSIDKMMLFRPEMLFFTHYGYSTEPEDVEKQIKKRLKDYKYLIENYEKTLEEKFSEYYIKECRDSGIKLETEKILNLFDIDIKLNTMGLTVWKKRRNA